MNRSDISLNGNGYTFTGYGMGSSSSNINGLTLNAVSNVTVKNWTITGSVFGITLYDTSNATVANNTITGTGNGIYALDEPTAGISVSGGGSNIIEGNNLENNNNGMVFTETQNNLIIGNTIENCTDPVGATGEGLVFMAASNNTIYHNSFIDNPGQAGNFEGGGMAWGGYYGPVPVNVWDDGYPGGGNYWSDYQTKYPEAAEINSSGLGNTPYVLDSQNKDRYPLMEPFTASFLLNYEQEVAPPKISVWSPLKQTYSTSNISLSFSLNKSVNWISYSLDGQQNVTITGNTTLTNMTNGEHTIVIYANDTFGDIGYSQTIDFNVALAALPFVLIVSVYGTIIALATVTGLLVYFKKHKRVDLGEHA